MASGADRQGWIDLLEACYDLSGIPAQWLTGLARAAEPLLDAGHGVTAQLFRLQPIGVAIEHSLHLGAPGLSMLPVASVSAAALDAVDLVFRSGIPASTMSEVVFSRLPGEAEIFAASTGNRYRDAVGIVAHTGTGTGVALNGPLDEPRAMGAVERRRWTHVAAHVGAGLRLRQRFGEQPDAILDSSGRVLDASDGASSRDARDRLREAVRRRAKARGAIKHQDPDVALTLWEGLVGGRWSLVDRFEEGGRHFIVAHRNDPELGDPRGLSRRERQVAEFAGLGLRPKEIAYALGLSPSAVTNAEGRARAKLGLGGRAELARFFSPRGLRRRLSELELAGEPILVASAPLIAEARLALLSPGERDVALLLVQGATNAAIAGRRGSTERTVANQVHAIFEKLGVHSRAELAATLAGDAEA